MSKKCANRLYGWWICQESFLSESIAAYNQGMLAASSAETSPVYHVDGTSVYAAGDDPQDQPLYRLDGYGAAVIEINGQMTKGPTSFGGTSNVRTRQALRKAAADPDVRGIMLMIDSPGGTVAGHKPLADEIARVAKIKPLHAHAEDGMHSAALWAGTQASILTASELTEIGSIGVVASIADYSQQFESDGVKVHVISTGDHKGAFTPGTEVTPDMLAEVQARVDQLNAYFVQAVKAGRKLSAGAVEKMATGKDWLAPEAFERGLIDKVMGDDDAMDYLRRDIRKLSSNNRRRSSMRAARIAAL